MIILMRRRGKIFCNSCRSRKKHETDALTVSILLKSLKTNSAILTFYEAVIVHQGQQFWVNSYNLLLVLSSVHRAINKTGRSLFSSNNTMFLSLRTKLLFSHGITIAFTALVLGLFTYLYMIADLKEVQEKRLHALALFGAHHLRDGLEERVSLFKRLAEAREVVEYSRKFQETVLLGHFLKFKDEFSSLAFLADDGAEEVRMESGRNSEELAAHGMSPLFLKSRKTPNTVLMTYLDLSGRAGVPVVHLCMTRHYYFADQLVGTLFGTFPVSSLFQDTEQYFTEGNENFLVIDNQGKVLFHQDRKLLYTNIFENDAQLKEALAGSVVMQGGFLRTNICGADSFVAYEPIADLGWTVLVVLPYKAFVDQPNKMRNVIAVLCILFVSIGLVYSYFLSSRIVSPLGRLANAAKRIAKGKEYEQLQDVHTRDEVGRLVEAFNHMSLDLRETTVSRDYADGIFQSLKEYLIVCNRKGEISLLNEAASRILGYSKKELIGRYLEQILPAELRVDALLNKETYEPGSSTEFETFFLAHDGGEVPVLFSLSAMHDKDGEHLGFVCLGLDISDYKAMEESLREAQKLEAIGTLAGGIAHDFNNILNVIMGYAQLAIRQTSEDDRRREMFMKINEAGKRAAVLVRQILTFSRQNVKEKRPLQLHLIVKETVKFLRGTLPASLIITQDIDKDCSSALADPAEIHQVVLNLCTNAYNAMGETGVLGITLHEVEVGEKNGRDLPELPDGKYICLSISDTGSGMDDKTMERIFDPYFTTDKKKMSSGLGLSVVHGIVKNCGGAILVESAPGKGSRFDVYLPAVTEENLLLDEAADHQVLPKLSARVLLVDDEETNAQLGKNILEDMGCTVTACTDSIMALQVFEKGPDDFDLVIADQIMPGLSGLALGKKILQLRPELPIILVSGFTEVLDEALVKRTGIRDYMLKPLSLKRLAEKILELT